VFLYASLPNDDLAGEDSMTVDQENRRSVLRSGALVLPADDLRSFWASSRMMQMGWGPRIGRAARCRLLTHFGLEMNPCHLHFREPCRRTVQKGIAQAGGLGWRIPTISG